jgi:predicted ArsR family transcriptional regulator
VEIRDDMQGQAKALADPSRFAMFRHIVHSEQPVGIAELTELLGFNHNAIRQHLAVLIEAEVIVESDERRTTRGRPRKLYSHRADALHAFSSVSGSYERLAELLLEVATSRANPYDVGFRAAASDPIADAADVASAADALAHRLAIDGFEPVIAGGAVSLDSCPYANVASKNPGIVCEIHRGLIDGYLSTQSVSIGVELKLRDPHRGGCRVELRVTQPS